MMTKHYRCNLIGDVVLNASLATEGNMDTLDYIPGSAFLGVVVNELFKNGSSSDALQIIRDGKVYFGDARIEIDGSQSYPMPFSYIMGKLHAKVDQDPIYLHHLIRYDQPIVDDDSRIIQLQQQRKGYLTVEGEDPAYPQGKYIDHIQQSFSLKSAYNAEQRRADEGKMYGFTAINAGQRFRFSVTGEETHLDMVNDIIIGKHYIGKSRSAQYGAVEIDTVDDFQEPPTFSPHGYTLVYAASNLCFYDQTGRPTLCPIASDLGLPSGEIDWALSQVRTHSYSVFNAKRNTTGTARYVITRGSVFYVSNSSIAMATGYVGVHRNEGLGAVVYNPAFLRPGDTSPQTAMQLTSLPIPRTLAADMDLAMGATSDQPLARLAIRRGGHEHDARDQAKKVNEIVDEWEKSTAFKKITSSQWGQIRAHATASVNAAELFVRLFWGDKEHQQKAKDDPSIDLKKHSKGYLAHGRAFDSLWKDGTCRILLRNKVLDYSPHLIAKIAAEMAKTPKVNKGKKQNDV